MIPRPSPGLRVLFAALVAVRAAPAAVPVPVQMATGHEGMVVAGHPQAAAAGVAVLKAGGNAVDAAIAVSLALGAAEPYASGLGGKIMLVHYDARSRRVEVVDAMDQASSAPAVRGYAHLPRNQRDYGYTAACVPGLAAGLYEAHRRWGVRPWADDVRAAEPLARDGFRILPKTAAHFRDREKVLRMDPELGRIYLPGGRIPEVGSTLANPDLARSMELLAERGPDAFYRGPIAAAIVAASRRAGGYFTLEDFAGYRARVEEPMRGRFQGLTIATDGPPASGGTLVLATLEVLDGDRWFPGPLRSPRNLDQLARTFAAAYPRARRTVGDVPEARRAAEAVLAPDSIAAIRRLAGSGAANGPVPAESEDPARSTTNFVVVDGAGNIVCATQSLSLHFGAGVVAPGTGIILNDTMSDFTLAASSPNAVAPGKRPASTISPALVFQAGKPILAIGIPGGARIPTAMIQVLVDYAAFHRPLEDAIGDTRIHFEGASAGARRDRIQVEESLPESAAAGLKALGWRVEREEPAGKGFYYGGFTAVAIGPDGALTGYADQRRTNFAQGY